MTAGGKGANEASEGLKRRRMTQSNERCVWYFGEVARVLWVT